jgi:hypothetical protein
MGRASGSKDQRHLHKLFNGRTTAQELWRRTLLTGKFCGKCRTAAAIGTINMWCPAEDFERLFPRIALQYATELEGKIPYVMFKSSGEARKFVALPVIYFCGACRSEMEKWAARKHSTVVAQIKTGPEPDKVYGQVPG